MADPRSAAPAPAVPLRRSLAARNKSFRKARDAAEQEYYRDLALEDLQKYFSPETWKKMTGLHLQTTERLRRDGDLPSVQKYFDPVAWEKLQRLGCLRGRPTAPAAPVTAARPCFSARTWETLTRLGVVPMTGAPRGAGSEGAGSGGDHRERDRDRGWDAHPDPDHEQSEEEDEDDGFLGHGMMEDNSLSSAVRLEEAEDAAAAAEARPGVPGVPGAAPSPSTDRLRQYFSDRHWQVLEERGLLQSALNRLAKETSV